MVLLDVCVSTCQRVLGGSNMSRTIPDALPRILGVACLAVTHARPRNEVIDLDSRSGGYEDLPSRA